MSLKIQATFLYSHINNSNIEDTHFKTITTLKVSSPSDVLETLFLNLSSNKVDVSNEYISTYFNKYISTHFVNDTINENIEEHIVRHNDNFLVFAFDKTDETVSVKYLSHQKEEPFVCSPSFNHTNTLREACDFSINKEEQIDSKVKTKKSIFKNLFSGFKGKKENTKVEA